ncbi:hypothetical protein [Paenibacillus rhizovicinus]|nr:hypothetical protein [Paenibacillus rhizovicinus]
MLSLLLLITAIGCGMLGKRTCGSDIEWVDFLKINSITYNQNHDGTKEVSAEQLGEKVGEIKYMLNGHACTNYKSANGDAAFLSIGTDVYALKGYNSNFRVVANNRVYEVSDNPNAKTIGDLMDIEGKVKAVGLESGRDGSLIGYFSQDAAMDFSKEILPLPLVGFNEVYKKIKNETGIFLRLFLKDGTSFRMVYYPDANAFANGGALGTHKLKLLVTSQRADIKAAAGL